MKVVSIVLLALLTTACAVNREYHPELEAYDIAKAKKDYLIGVSDMLSVSVWKNEDLTIDVPVRPDGKISVPLVGDVLAAGESAESLAEKVTKELSNYIRTPQVTIIVTQATSTTFLQRVRITGAVASPLAVPYGAGITVMDLVLGAGGLTPFADANGALLYRMTKEGQKVYPLYLEDILDKGDLRSNYTLNPSDIITVPESTF